MFYYRARSVFFNDNKFRSINFLQSKYFNKNVDNKSDGFPSDYKHNQKTLRSSISSGGKSEKDLKR